MGHLTALLGEVHAIHIEADASQLALAIHERSEAFVRACKSALTNDEVARMDQFDIVFRERRVHFIDIRILSSSETHVYQLTPSTAGGVRAAQTFGIAQKLRDMEQQIDSTSNANHDQALLRCTMLSALRHMIMLATKSADWDALLEPI